MEVIKETKYLWISLCSAHETTPFYAYFIACLLQLCSEVSVVFLGWPLSNSFMLQTLGQTKMVVRILCQPYKRQLVSKQINNISNSEAAFSLFQISGTNVCSCIQITAFAESWRGHCGDSAMIYSLPLLCLAQHSSE